MSDVCAFVITTKILFHNFAGERTKRQNSTALTASASIYTGKTRGPSVFRIHYYFLQKTLGVPMSGSSMNIQLHV